MLLDHYNQNAAEQLSLNHVKRKMIEGLKRMRMGEKIPGTNAE